jgi:type IV pilus assembly protein PilC
MSKLKIFPNRIVSLVKVGEEVNQLDKINGKLSDDLSRDVDQKSKTIGKPFEPALILVMVELVAFILVAMYLLLFEMSKSMK